ncbi:MAG: exo-alpha-sialidase [Xanthomonadales bacterium]|nr:exo-alpha-sialidase [Xanthomonadales bacterium]
MSTTPAQAGATLAVEPWPLPATRAPSAQPDLAAAPDGRLVLAWIEKSADGAHALRLARSQLRTTAWDAPRTVAAGRDWFVNWADTPHVLALGDGSLWAHWLRRNGAGTYDYGIALVRSDDDGESWSTPIRVEPDGAKNDYGFVSMWAHSRDTLGIAWLDSRRKPAATGDGHSAREHDGHGAARMMLRAATFPADGRRTIEWVLDASTCDCCTTAVASTSRGPVLVYRGRSDGEIRDTRLVRFENDRWTLPRDVHPDGWTFAGCPVNGPAIAALGNEVWVAWYTEADGKPSLRLARSRDAGDSFSAPLHVAEGEGVLGRAALAFDADKVWLAWLAERDGGRDGQHLWLARVDARTATIEARQVVASLAARGRATGLPRLVARDGEALLVVTDIKDGQPLLRGLRVR